jgi:hypothetical protein
MDTLQIVASLHVQLQWVTAAASAPERRLDAVRPSSIEARPGGIERQTRFRATARSYDHKRVVVVDLSGCGALDASDGFARDVTGATRRRNCCSRIPRRAFDHISRTAALTKSSVRHRLCFAAQVLREPVAITRDRP